MRRLVDFSSLNYQAQDDLFGPFPPSLRCPCCHSLWSQSTPSWITSKEGEFSVYPTLVILLLFIPVRRICEYTFVPGPFTAITEKV